MIIEFIKGNKYLTREQQMKRQLVKGILITTVILGVLFSLYYFLYLPELIEYEKKAAIKNYTNSEQITAYKVVNDIVQGEKIDVKKDVVEVSVPKYLVANDMIGGISQLEKTVARMSIKQNTILSKSMVLLEDDILTRDLRKQDYSHIKLNSNLQVGNFVDIRYKKKNGDDFIVAAKKKVLSVNGNVMILNITEGERQYINNATVKASLTEGEIYTTIYVDPQNQEAAKVNYHYDLNIDRLIKDNPTIVQQSQD